MAQKMRTNLLGIGQVISTPKDPNHSNDPQAIAGSEDVASHSEMTEMANAIRFLAMDAVEKAQSGHPGMPMGCADILTILWTEFISFDPHQPDWPNRDRFVLSAGHGSMALYALLYLIGVKGVNIEDIENFRQLHSRTPGHPERHCLPGVEVTTGPLGQGLGMAVGMAIAERHLNHLYGDDIANHFTYVLASDGDLMEGISHESITLAGHLALSQLIVLYDSNQTSIDGNTELATSDDIIKRFDSAHWHTVSIDGHDHQAIADALREAQKSELPSLILCQTKIGFGAPNKEASTASHGAPLGPKEIAATRKALGWDAKPFEIPNKILDTWRITGLKIAKKRGEWQKKWNSLDSTIKANFSRSHAGNLPDGIERVFSQCKRTVARERNLATRKASGLALEMLAPLLPELIGGSADLTESNATKTKTQQVFSANDRAGTYIHYGVREHGMTAAINGMAAHGGVLPYGGTFLIFSDYSRPAIRLSAMMKLHAIYIFTHDSIGLGQDGPTHQPIEHLASLRAIPNLYVFRPADAIETVECWQIALQQKNNPSAILLTRQNVRTLRNAQSEANRSRYGAYELRHVDGNEDLTLIASGSEVDLALQVRRKLASQRVAARVVSVPCLDLFLEQSDEYRAQILGTSKLRIIIEAASNSNWQTVAGEGSLFIGLDQFGASAPYQQLFSHFGLDEDMITKTALALIEKRRKKEKEKKEAY